MNKKAFYSSLYKEEGLYKIAGGGTENPTAQFSEPVIATPAPIKEEPQIEITKNKTVVIYNNQQELPAEDLELLGKILAAINKSTDSTIQLNTSKDDVQLESFQSCTIIGFGVENSFSSILNKYELKNLESNRIVLSDSLSDLSGSNDLKRALWNCLKMITES